MYERPSLQRLGSLQTMTQGGGTNFVDPYGPNAAGNGCTQITAPRQAPTLICVGGIS